MSIVKQLVERMHGSIQVESTPGVETCFTVILPFAIDPNPPQRRKRLENADISGKRILVVEDNELNMEIAEYILKEAGASVEKAETGKWHWSSIRFRKKVITMPFDGSDDACYGWL